MKVMLQRLTWLGKGLVLCAVITAAGIYVLHAQRSANPHAEVQAAEDSYTIDLTLAPEVQEFEGFINYGSPINTAGTDALGNPVTIMLGSKSIPQPVFSTRKLAEPVAPKQPVVSSESKNQVGPLSSDVQHEHINKAVKIMAGSLGELVTNPASGSDAISTSPNAIQYRGATSYPTAEGMKQQRLFHGSKAVGTPLIEIVLPTPPPRPPQTLDERSLDPPSKPVVLSGSKSYSGPVVSAARVVEELNKLRAALGSDPTQKQQKGDTLDHITLKKLELPRPADESLETANSPKLPASIPSVAPSRRIFFSGSKVSAGPIFKVEVPVTQPFQPSLAPSETTPGALTLPPQPK
jgi:hypothetical protein